ncbi:MULTISPECIES: hypothetical protein [unclassified Pseudomonas]|jgi:hypothetical protein|uniref:hypothetical protein n=1 Tax=unclassified Pseudomonas TaxID=196821 RepID=UPI00026FD1CE|nr:hypothetical protein [Pseudomonas sp. GM80]EJN23192.1 hypothetical protein PMI37_04759 [Pseudomonas sp. GM80]
MQRIVSARHLRREKSILAALLFCVTSWGALWMASQWWEKALAEPSHEPQFSPNGCYWLQQFRPYWVLPGFFHSNTHPDDTVSETWPGSWEFPAFFRLYDRRTYKVLGESNIYDLVSVGGPVSWDYDGGPSASVGMIQIESDSPGCVAKKTDSH